MSIHINWEFLFSFITAGVAIAALFQTRLQIKISNKQHLFDKRVEIYIIASGLVRLYEQNRESINKNKEDTSTSILDVALKFVWMTNNSYLEKLSEVIADPLSNASRKEFLAKMEDIKEISMKIKLLFSDSETISDFVYCYQQMLTAMYQYRIMILDMDNATKEYKWSLKQCEEELGEKNVRDRLIKHIEELEKIYCRIGAEKTEEKMEEQIKLK
ncbi:hypothetical protein DWW31_18340 [Clostridium sp. AF15-17LB]|nr:hypothetical protein DWW31_18340 [Clostridium sp. AF15-17LB]